MLERVKKKKKRTNDNIKFYYFVKLLDVGEIALKYLKHLVVSLVLTFILLTCRI